MYIAEYHWKFFIIFDSIKGIFANIIFRNFTAFSFVQNPMSEFPSVRSLSISYKFWNNADLMVKVSKHVSLSATLQFFRVFRISRRKTSEAHYLEFSLSSLYPAQNTMSKCLAIKSIDFLLKKSTKQVGISKQRSQNTYLVTFISFYL